MGCGESKPEVEDRPEVTAVSHVHKGTNGLLSPTKSGAGPGAEPDLVSSADSKAKASLEPRLPADGREEGGGDAGSMDAGSADAGIAAPSDKVLPSSELGAGPRAESLHDSPMSSTARAAPQRSPFQMSTPFDSGGQPPAASASTSRTMIFKTKDESPVEVTVSGPHPSSLDYQGPPLLSTAAERARCHALKRLGIDLQSQESVLDFITKLCTNICGVPAAFITFTDDKFTYIKSSSVEEYKERVPTDRQISLTSWTLVPLKPEVLVVEDLSQDKRFASHPFVRAPPSLRFMAAAPLLDASGQRLGALSVVDYKPRKFDAEQCNVLCNFAEMVMREVQRLSEMGVQRAMSLNPTPENEQLLRTMDACSDGVVLLDVRLPRWPVLFSNQGWTEITGFQPVSGSIKCFWDMFQLPGVSVSKHPWELYEDAVEMGDIFTLDVIVTGGSGKHLLPVTFKPASTEQLDSGMVSISIPAQPNHAPGTPVSKQAKRLFYFGTLTRPVEGESRPPTSSLTPTASTSLAQPEEDANPIPGVKLGTLLGKGSFGSVYYGTWNGAQIAVKVIQHMATEAERKARDEQLEAILGLKMMHPNIVRTFQFATKDRTGTRQPSIAERLRREMLQDDTAMNSGSNAAGTPTGQRRMMETWIVLELCNRGSLQDAIDKGAFKAKGTASPDGAPNMLNIMRTATEIVGAMTYLHSLDILHSDLNGNNILLISNTGIDDRPFSVKVSDFGLSRIHIGERTVATQTYGTVTHMPPELLAEGRLSKAADVYAFGVLLWEMYTGQRPWSGLRHVQIITHKMRHGSQLKWPPTVNPGFKEIAQQCMSPDPHERPTFSEVLDMLEPLRQAAERGELESFAADAKPSSAGASQKPVSTLLGPVEQIPE